MRILGTGIDIVQISAIAGVLARRGMRFPQKILHITELDDFDEFYAKDPPRALQFLASRHTPLPLLPPPAFPHLWFVLCDRFALKEATYKALQPAASLFWKDIAVTRKFHQKPTFIMTPKMMQVHKDLRIAGTHVSLSHDGDYAIASVMFEHHD